MPNDHKIDIKILEQKANSIRDALAKLFTDQDLKNLILHWRKPGWTTPAEFILLPLSLIPCTHRSRP